MNRGTVDSIDWGSTAEDIGDASKAKWQRRALADEIARAAVLAARHDTGLAQLSPAADRWFDDHDNRCAASWMVGYARGYLDGRGGR